MSESSGEKTFLPTERRIREAATKGDVLRPRELGTAIVILAGTAWLKWAGPWMLDTLMAAVRSGFLWDRAAIDGFAPGPALLRLLVLALPPMLLLGAAVGGLSVAAQLGIADGRWVGANVLPRASRINPLSGLGRMFGATGAIEIAKGIAKVILLGAIAWMWGKSRIATLAGLGRGSLHAQLAFGWDAIVSLLFALSAGLLVIALADLPVQWLRRILRLRMSRQDMRDEHKESEGSPEARAAQRDRQRRIAMGGVAHALREAQFVITNPTHFAVALAYDPAVASAPVVLAKGRGDKALAIRDLARDMAVPCLEYPALARSVYYTTRERQVIREELYAAVAALLAFVLSIRRGEHPPVPHINVPVTLRFDADGCIEMR